MGKIPQMLRDNVAKNIRNCRSRKYSRWGGSKQCAEDFGVSPKQWSQWERGVHMPDEFRMQEIARFFGVSTEYLRRDNSGPHAPVLEGALLSSRRVFRGGEEEEPLRVEVERLPGVHPSFCMDEPWRGLTITIERKR